MSRFFVLELILISSLFSCASAPAFDTAHGSAAVSGTPAARHAASDEHYIIHILDAAAPVVPAEPASSAGKLPAEESLAERVLTAIRDAYPRKIEEVSLRDGDWAIRVAGEWFFWAEGRMLPEAERGEWERYDPIPFYTYPRELRPIPDYSEAEKAELIELVRQREKDPALRHSGFFGALWRAWDSVSSWERVKTTWFLGMRTLIHRELLEDLAAVEEEILIAMRSDPELKAFVDSLDHLAGYTWRRIAGTSSLSFHSYGTAIDIVPRSYGNRHAYWRWVMDFDDEWFLLPYEKRFMPPEAFVRAFENHGFIWGGKWRFFDTIHFEYRPEVLLLNGIETRR